MFVLQSKSYLILNTSDLEPNEKNEVIIYDLANETMPRRFSLPHMSGELNGKDTNKTSSNKIICGCVSSTEKYIALCDNSKQLFVLNVPHIEPVKCFIMKKNCTKLLFVHDDTAILGCDKTGDIYLYELTLENISQREGRLLLGHCSMLLDFVLSSDGKYIISCDRDEKIRITQYPNCYNIEGYCLGHTEFVSSLVLLDEKTLLSGGGDGKLILWDFFRCKKLYTLQIDKSENDQSNVDSEERKYKYPIKTITTDDQNRANHLVVSFYNQCEVLLYKVVRIGEWATSLELLCQLTLDSEPLKIQFDFAHSNFLWLWGGFQSKPVCLYELRQDQLVESYTSVSCVDLLNQNEHFIKNIDKERDSNVVEGLFKHYYNNVEMYHQRKLLRIENENKNKSSL